MSQGNDQDGPEPDDDGLPAISVAIYVPTRGKVTFTTADALARIANFYEINLPKYIRSKESVFSARNMIVADFLSTDGDILMMCDDDVLPPPNCLNAINYLLDGSCDVVSIPCPLIKHLTIAMPNIFRVTEDSVTPIAEAWTWTGFHGDLDAVGTGCIFITRELLEDEGMQAPFMPEWGEQGQVVRGEDISFCLRARDLGYRVGAVFDFWADHSVELFANALNLAYLEAWQRAGRPQARI